MSIFVNSSFSVSSMDVQFLDLGAGRGLFGVSFLDFGADTGVTFLGLGTDLGEGGIKNMFSSCSLDIFSCRLHFLI